MTAEHVELFRHLLPTAECKASCGRGRPGAVSSFACCQSLVRTPNHDALTFRRNDWLRCESWHSEMVLPPLYLYTHGSHIAICVEKHMGWSSEVRADVDSTLPFQACTEGVNQERHSRWISRLSKAALSSNEVDHLSDLSRIRNATKVARCKGMIRLVDFWFRWESLALLFCNTFVGTKPAVVSSHGLFVYARKVDFTRRH